MKISEIEYYGYKIGIHPTNNGLWRYSINGVLNYHEFNTFEDALYGATSQAGLYRTDY